MVEGVTFKRWPTCQEFWADVRRRADRCKGVNFDRAMLEKYDTQEKRSTFYFGYMQRSYAVRKRVSDALGVPM